MTIDLRQNSIFSASKDIFFDPKVSRRARAIYIAICFLLTIPKTKDTLTLDYVAKCSGYNRRVAKEAIKELESLGFLVFNKEIVGLIK